MASVSPSPIQQVTSRSPVADPLHSPTRLSASYQEPRSPSKIGLVSSQNGQRSYGTVNKLSSSFKRSSVSVVNHTLEEGETLQGLALKYNTTVHDIQRLNNIWSTESMFCKTTLKIPISYHSNDSSLSNTPSGSPLPRHKNMTSISENLPNGNLGSEIDRHRESDGEEVRSKQRVRRQRSESVTATCGEDGVKNIADILNCADLQLQASRDFAEKLAQRSATFSLPKDAYHRTHDALFAASPALTIPETQRETSPKSKKRLHLKRVDLAPDKLQENREKLEENIFEL